MAMESINSDVNSDASAENTIDSQNLGKKSLENKLSTNLLNYFPKLTTNTEMKRKGMIP